MSATEGVLRRGETALPAPGLETYADYGRDFAALDYWRPYVAAVCAHHGLPCETVRGGVPGTCPTWLVDERYVVKFFGRLYEGGHSYAVEAAVYEALAGQSDGLTPRLVAAGRLCDDGVSEGWPWPYLVSTYLSGRPLAELGDVAPAEDLAAMARQAGEWLWGLHETPLHAAEVTEGDPLALSWAPFLAFLARQRCGCGARHLAWGGLPAHLAAQVDEYLAPAEELVDTGRPPQLLHADLTEDHLLGERTADGWRLAGVIDFGDARVGERAYELGALHLGAWRADKRLLQDFLAGYGAWDWGPEEVRRAMNMALLHQFDVFGQVAARYPEMARIETLDELARRLWDLEAPGVQDMARA
jgi:hygromycin-B 7''-O-kinase